METVNHVDAPSNMVPVYVASYPGRALVDTGASMSILSDRYYDRLLRAKCKIDKLDANAKYRPVTNASGGSMRVNTKVNVDIKIGGITIPAIFFVVEKLAHDIIIGTDLLQAMEAVIDHKTNTLVLFDGLTIVPMTKTSEHLVVKTTANVVIPAYSEAVISVNCIKRPGNSDYMVEEDVRAPCQSLIVARTLVDTSKASYSCRVMNITQIKTKDRSRCADACTGGRNG
jgi:predicted aspartyl protease